MALKENTQAPDFTLASTAGTDFNLATTQKGKPCIIYFYPQDFTPACTKEACTFRDQWDFFEELDIDIYGISRDSIETHQRFIKAYELPFTLLSDTDGKVSALYKATIPFVKMTRRITYVLDENHVIKGVYENLLNGRKHVQMAVNMIKQGKAQGAQ